MATFTAEAQKVSAGQFRATLTRHYLDGGTMVRSVSFEARNLQRIEQKLHDIVLGEIIGSPRVIGVDISDIHAVKGE
ncbi:MAG: hypothetical protein Q8L24_00185 [bacterium]|nr:hypothetical protein [bacterium]